MDKMNELLIQLIKEREQNKEYRIHINELESRIEGFRKINQTLRQGIILYSDKLKQLYKEQELLELKEK